MKTSNIIATIIASATLLLTACGGGVKKDEPTVDLNKLADEKAEVHGTEVKASDVTITNPLNADWVAAGKGTYELKCQSCHRLTEEKLVGPGWKNVPAKKT